MMPEFVVEVRGLQVRYGDVLAVRGVDLGVAARSIVALMGPSGCGKTSLLRAIGGFEVPAAGVISIAGRQMSGGRAWIPPERRQVGMVFQEGACFRICRSRTTSPMGCVARPGPTTRSSECCSWSGWSNMGIDIRMSSREVNSSVSRWRERWHRHRRSCCWTSLSPASIQLFGCAFARMCTQFSVPPGQPPCWSPTIRKRR